MASTLAMSVPALVLVAFTLQGCLIADLKPAVKIAIGHACHERADKFFSETGFDVQSKCRELDQEKLKELEVTDCPQALHEYGIDHVEMGCEMSLAHEAVEKCRPFDGKACNAAVSSKADAINCNSGKCYNDTNSDMKFPTMKSLSDKPGFEAQLGAEHACRKGCSKMVHSEKMQKHAEKMCSQTDDEAMTAMGVDRSKCMEYLTEAFTDFSVFFCNWYIWGHKDAPKPEEATMEWIKTSVEEFLEEQKNSPEKSLEKDWDLWDSSLKAERRLRLFEMIQNGEWPKRLRWWSPATITAASTASALVLAALLGAAWRRRRAGQDLWQDTEPILDDGLAGHDMQPVA